MTNKSQTLYVGVTSDLQRRVEEHKQKLIQGFTSRYNIDRLVHYETFGSSNDAIYREKQLKGLLRAKKIALIEEGNPAWRDISDDWRNQDHHA